jgi:hypothetical protein
VCERERERERESICIYTCRETEEGREGGRERVRDDTSKKYMK